MPEGHTIHRLARDQSRAFVCERLAVTSPQGRFRAGARRLDGRRLERIEAYGKHLFYWWEDGPVLHVHLGLYGKFRQHKSPPPEPRGAVRLRAVGAGHAFDLNGPAACEVFDAEGRDRIAARLGQDPLRPDADREVARRRVCSSRALIGRLLLDQSVIAGVGNIFRAEALFSTGIHPGRAGTSLSGGEFDALWETLTSMLRVGVRYNRIITSDPKAVGKPPSRMSGGERFQVYGKEHCPRCDGAIKAWELAARTVYACGRCQPQRRGATTRRSG